MMHLRNRVLFGGACFSLPFIMLALAALAWPQATALVPVVARPMARTIDLPAELLPFLSVSLHAKVAGYIDRVLVDRGSAVHEGDLLIELSAPELEAQIAEALSKVQAAESDRLQAEAQLAAAESTYERLKEAAGTPGAVAGNELVQAEKQVEAARALVLSRQQASRAAESAADAQKSLSAYLRITAPFEGTVTDRLVHPGALAGPPADPPLLVLQQVSHLRLVVPVPEEDVAGVVRGATVAFHVPAYPERAWSGTVARIGHALDRATRTMPVELDVANRDGSLAPGMYANVAWPVRRAQPSLWVPRSAVVTTTERTFVIRDRAGVAEWVDVRKGPAEGDLVQVIGNLRPGDLVAHRGTDELREGSAMPSQTK